MNKILLILAILSIFYGTVQYDGGSKAPVILAGSIVKNIGNEPVKKYPRKNCPVCKGTGKYLSGDGIEMVDCGYCEPEKKQEIMNNRTKDCVCKECKCKNCGCYK